MLYSPSIPAPTTTGELLSRSYNLAGRTTAEIAQEMQIKVPDNLLHNKGWFGTLIELYLGATAGSNPTQDFTNLGIELKTIPLDDKGLPLETTFVCYTPLLGTAGLTYEKSNVRNKLKKVLWVPFLGMRTVPIAQRIIFTPFLWEPDAVENQLLKTDWQEHMEKINLGDVEKITARDGEVLQIRPKAANGKALTEAIGKDGKIIMTRPRGFYLRKNFTEGILRKSYL